jgi:hypothetical protein
MAISLNDNIKVNANKPIDFKFGPFDDIDQANSLIPIAQRYQGLIFGLYVNYLNPVASDVEFYYYWGDLSDTTYKPLLFGSGDNNEVSIINLTSSLLSGTGSERQQIADYINTNIPVNYIKQYSKLNVILEIES